MIVKQTYVSGTKCAAMTVDVVFAAGNATFSVPFEMTKCVSLSELSRHVTRMLWASRAVACTAVGVATVWEGRVVVVVVVVDIVVVDVVVVVVRVVDVVGVAKVEDEEAVVVDVEDVVWNRLKEGEELETEDGLEPDDGVRVVGEALRAVRVVLLNVVTVRTSSGGSAWDPVELLAANVTIVARSSTTVPAMPPRTQRWGSRRRARGAASGLSSYSEPNHSDAESVSLGA